MVKGKYSILIADDMKPELMTLDKILNPEYKVYAVGNGNDAISAAEKFLPDIILLDVEMPEMNGYEVIAALKKSEKTKHIPVIFITALSEEEDEEKGLALGAVDYITKPFSPAIVKLRLDNQIKMLEQLRTIERQIDEIRTLEYENVKNMLDSTPYTCHLWNRRMEMLDCNEASMQLFKCTNKKEFIERFNEFSPEYQPDGKLSSEKARESLQAVFDNGKGVFDYVHKTSDGVIIPCEMTLVRIKLQSDDFIVAYLKDLREHNAMMAEIRMQDNLLYTVSHVAGILLQSSMESFNEDMYTCMGMMAEAVDADRVYIWKNHDINGELCCTQIYEWSGGSEPQQGKDITINISYRENIPEWEETLSVGTCINSRVKDMSPASQAQLSPQGILSIFVTPVFLHGEFWGFIGFDDCHNERVFSDNEELILRSAGLLITNAMLKNEMTVNLTSSAVKLEAALEEAHAANKAKSNFLSNMSHEIRTPMNAITGMGELLLHEHLNERQRGYINDIVVSAKALLGIINDILDFSKIESGKLELNPVDYDFNAFIEQINSMFVHITQKKGLEFRLECGDNLPKVLYGDDLRLRQALTNIIGNAVKFTEKGYVRLKITAKEDSLIFEIKDTGIGIRKEDQPKLFNAFAQVDTSKNRNIVGTGLGLVICKSFVEMMGGSITLESEYGQGTAFTIVTPVVIGSKERIESRAAAKETNIICAPDAKILVVDDNGFNLKVASGLLGLMEIKTETADSGFKAIDLIKQNDYDIVFMDHMMPEMDGIETVQEIRKLGGKYETVIIVALTANAITGAREMFLANGFNDFISKPINSGELQEIIKKYLPSCKIQMEARNENPQAVLNKEEQLRRKSAVTFVKENRDTYARITGALSSGDIKTAHRIAHTLKSIAGYLGKTALQEAARILESSLQKETAGHTPQQLETFEKELSSALAGFEPLVKEAESVKREAVQIDAGEKASLLAEIRPFLERGDFGAADYVDKLKGIKGMEELASRIDDYDFEGALQSLDKIST